MTNRRDKTNPALPEPGYAPVSKLFEAIADALVWPDDGPPDTEGVDAAGPTTD